jgi:hypothetical protein
MDRQYRVPTRRLTFLVVLQLLLQLGDQASLLLVVRLLLSRQGSRRNTGSGNGDDGDDADGFPVTGTDTGETSSTALEVLLSGHAVTDDTLVRRRLGTSDTSSTQSGGTGSGGESTGSDTSTGVVRVVLTVGDTSTDDGNVRSGPVVSSDDGDVRPGPRLVVTAVRSDNGNVRSGPGVVSVVSVVVPVRTSLVELAKGVSSGLLSVQVVVTRPDDTRSLPLNLPDGASGQTTEGVVPRSIVLSVGTDSLGVRLEGRRASVSTSNTSLA